MPYEVFRRIHFYCAAFAVDKTKKLKLAVKAGVLPWLDMGTLIAKNDSGQSTGSEIKPPDEEDWFVPVKHLHPTSIIEGLPIPPCDNAIGKNHEIVLQLIVITTAKTGIIKIYLLICPQ